jgi:hypothetical protein
MQRDASGFTTDIINWVEWEGRCYKSGRGESIFRRGLGIQLWAELFRSGARSKGGREAGMQIDITEQSLKVRMYFNLLVSKFNPHHSIYFLIVLTLTYISKRPSKYCLIHFYKR